MQIVDTILATLAPHECFGCGRSGHVLCLDCTDVFHSPPPPRCVGCHRLQSGYKTCSTCKGWLPTYAVYVANMYEGPHEMLIREYKFEQKRQAAQVLSRVLASMAHDIPQDTIVTHVPTAPSRVRSRGFDHGKLLAKSVAAHLDRQHLSLLRRTTNTRQVGASRKTRMAQMAHEFEGINLDQVKNKTVLLVDDVFTTGATLAAASKTLKEAGATRIYATVYAQKV